jgi:amicyanin
MPALRNVPFTWTLAAVVVVLALMVAALPISPARAGTIHAVQIVDFAFTPAVVTVAVGDTVTWTNQDAVAHTATSTTGAFDSGLLDQGESYSLTFTAAGTYPYLCTPHPGMTGTVVVMAAAAPTAAAPVPTSSPSGALPNVAIETPMSAPSYPLVIGAALLVVSLAVGARRARRRPG